MTRILLTVAYDGTNYGGWQRQLNAPSVQQELEKALTTAIKTPISVTGASRTDAGVHARGQKAHFDTLSRIPVEKYPYVLNSLLPRDIRVSFARAVPDAFHARFSSHEKTYVYRVYNAPHADPLSRLYSAHVPLPIDEKYALDSALCILGEHDFSAFCASGGTYKSPLRTIKSLSFAREGDMLTLTVVGNAFLYNMVRIIAGTLISIGQRKLPFDAFEQALETKDRLCLGPTAPAHGLTLEMVSYPGDDEAEGRFQGEPPQFAIVARLRARKRPLPRLPRLAKSLFSCYTQIGQSKSIPLWPKEDQTMRLSDTIESFIKEMLSQETEQVDLKRNELAEYFHCAPSQINYVLSTRFTPDHGYVISSQRGGGGYIRIVRLSRTNGEQMAYLMRERIGESLDYASAQAILRQLCERQVITLTDARLMLSALSPQALSVPLPEALKDALRAKTLRAMLLEIMQRGEKG